MTRVEALKLAEKFPKYTLCVLSAAAGHEEYTWDPDDEASSAVAVLEFNHAKRDGMTGVHIDENGVGETIGNLDPKTHERVVMIPQIQGG